MTDNPPMTKGDIKNGDFVVGDTGHRKVFETGAQRDAGPGKGYFHCLPYVAMEALARLYEAGAIKYGRDNWKRGIPLSCFLDSMLRHALKLAECRLDEDHTAAVMWNAAGFAWTAAEIEAGRLPSSLDNVGWIQAQQAKQGRGADTCEVEGCMNEPSPLSGICEPHETTPRTDKGPFFGECTFCADLGKQTCDNPSFHSRFSKR